jgi:hypothetical protein
MFDRGRRGCAALDVGGGSRGARRWPCHSRLWSLDFVARQVLLVHGGFISVARQYFIVARESILILHYFLVS